MGRGRGRGTVQTSIRPPRTRRSFRGISDSYLNLESELVQTFQLSSERRGDLDLSIDQIYSFGEIRKYLMSKKVRVTASGGFRFIIDDGEQVIKTPNGGLQSYLCQIAEYSAAQEYKELFQLFGGRPAETTLLYTDDGMPVIIQEKVNDINFESRDEFLDTENLKTAKLALDQIRKEAKTELSSAFDEQMINYFREATIQFGEDNDEKVFFDIGGFGHPLELKELSLSPTWQSIAPQTLTDYITENIKEEVLDFDLRNHIRA